MVKHNFEFDATTYMHVDGSAQVIESVVDFLRNKIPGDSLTETDVIESISGPQRTLDAFKQTYPYPSLISFVKCSIKHEQYTLVYSLDFLLRYSSHTPGKDDSNFQRYITVQMGEKPMVQLVKELLHSLQFYRNFVVELEEVKCTVDKLGNIRWATKSDGHIVVILFTFVS